MGGFHMGFGGSDGAAASVLDTIRSVGAAAQRQQMQAQQQTLKDQFEQELKLRKEGYTPYMQTTGQDASGLKRRDAQQVDPSRVISDPFGRKWVAPAPATDGPDPQKTFSDTAGLLEKGARPVDAGGNVDQMQQTPRYRMDESGKMTDTGMFGIHAAPPDGSTVTPPGSKQSYYVPPADETLATKLRTEAAGKTGTPAVDTEHFSVPVSIDHASGKVTPLQLPAGVTHNDKAEKPQKFTYSHFSNNEGKVTHTRTSEDGVEMWNGKSWVSAPASAAIGERHRDPNEPTPGQSGVQGRFDQKETDAAINQHETLQDAEQKAWTTKQSYVDLAETARTAKAGESVIDPKSGKEVFLTDKNRTAWQKVFSDRAAEAERQAMGYQNRAKGIRQRHGFGEFQGGGQQQQRTGAPPPAPPANIVQSLTPGEHTFRNGQTWRKGSDGSMTYVSGGQ